MGLACVLMGGSLRASKRALSAKKATAKAYIWKARHLPVCFICFMGAAPPKYAANTATP
jgi:hypothetical protein